jgi:predicted ester cyclase
MGVRRIAVNRVLSFALIGVALTISIALRIEPPRAAAQDATPAAKCPATTPEENKDLVRRWFATLSGGSSEDFASVAAEKIIYHDPSPREEAQTGGTEDWASNRQQDYPDLQVTVEQLIAEGNMVASYERYTGTQEGDVEDQQGVPATGLPTEWVSMANFRIECGKIAEIWSVADDLGRLERLGVITDEELQSVEPVATPSS